MKKPSSIVVLPFRLKSERLPEKILEDIGGIPLMIRAIKATSSALLETQVLLVAVDSERSAEQIKKHGMNVEVIMTQPSCPSGTDRVFKAVQSYTKTHGLDTSHLKVINVQGDMPFVNSDVLRSFFETVEKNKTESYFTLACPWPTALDRSDISKVKCILNAQQHALYFSRSPIPHQADSTSKTLSLLHIGAYAYKYEFLERFCNLAPSPLELSEKLEQLRALENGFKLWVKSTKISIQMNFMELIQRPICNGLEIE